MFGWSFSFGKRDFCTSAEGPLAAFNTEAEQRKRDKGMTVLIKRVCRL